MNVCPGHRADTPSPELYTKPVTLHLYTGQPITTPNNPNGLDIHFSDEPNETNWAYSIDGVHGYYWSQSGVSLCWWSVAGNGNNFVRFSGVPTKGPLGTDGPGVVSLYTKTNSSGIVDPGDLIVTFIIADMPTPQITSTPPVGVYQQSYSYQLTVGPTNTAPIINPVFSNYTGLPGGLTGSSSGLISGIPLKIGPRTFKVHITCQGNPTGVDAYQTITIIENPPTVGNLSVTATADSTCSVNIPVVAGRVLSYALEDNPAWITLPSAVSPSITIAPTGFFPCSNFYVVKMKAFNTNATPGVGYLEVTVLNSRTPELAAGVPPPGSYYVGESMTLQIKAKGCVDSIILDPTSAALPTGMAVGVMQDSPSDDEYSQFVDVAGTPLDVPNLYPFKLRATRTAAPPASGTAIFNAELIYRKPEVTWPTTTYEWLESFPGFSTPAIPAVNNPTGHPFLPQDFIFSAPDLAAIGLSMDSGTGAITGTPTPAFSGTISVVCSNGTLYPGHADPQGVPSAGDTSGVVRLLIDTAANLTPVITSPSFPFDTDLPWDGGDPQTGGQAGYATGIRDTAMSYQITATHYPTSYGSTALPAGLTLNAATGLISGIPTEEGSFDVTVSATNQFALTGTLVVRFLISYPAPVITSPLYTFGMTGEAFDPPQVWGGQPPPPAGYHITASIQDADTISSYEADLSAVNPPLPDPATLSIDTSTGVVSGIVTVPTNSYPMTVKAHNIGAHVIPAGTSWGNPNFPGSSYTVPAQEPTTANGGAAVVKVGVYGNPPIIANVSPNALPATGGNITITGSNFVSGATVLVGSIGTGYTAGTSVVVTSSTTITANIGAMDVSDIGYDVVVINPDNQAGTLTGALFVLPVGGSLFPTTRYTSLLTGQSPIYNIASTGGRTTRRQRVFGLGTNVEVLFYSGIAGNALLNVQRKQSGTTSTRHAAGDLVFKGVVSVGLSPAMYKSTTGNKISDVFCVLRSNGRVDMQTMKVDGLSLTDDADIAYAAFHAAVIRSLPRLSQPLIGSTTCTET
jgi:hypothetical protein